MKHHVLVVDDDLSLRISLGDALLPLKVKVDQESVPEKMMERLGQQVYRAVLLDLHHAETQDVGLLQFLTQHRPDVPVLVLTDSDSPATWAELIKSGARTVLSLPFDEEALRNAVAPLLDTYRLNTLKEERYELALKNAETALAYGFIEAARHHAHVALGLFGDRSKPFVVLGVVEQLSLNLEQAMRMFRTALVLDFRNKAAEKNLANLTGFPKHVSEYVL